MSSVDSVSMNIEQFKKLDYPVERVHVESAGNFKYKYYVGPFTDKQEAKKCRKTCRLKVLADAFIVQFD
ncbi:MAG: SPOR domain-containing protein [Crocinitomicaceae bacterium]|nr:SPOR domain-containing protein [Crocinitomicaceae bacterium]